MNDSHARRFWRALLPSLVLCASAVPGQETESIAALRATQHPASSVGLAIGERIPDFRARDQDGNEQDFESIRGPNGAVLYFYRSADWCIYCQTQLVDTEASRDSLRKNGLGVVGISGDSPEILKKFADGKGIDFPLLADSESRIIRDFQVLDATVLPGSPGYGVPYHGHYIVDENGIVTAKLFDAKATMAHSTGVVVSRLFGSPLNTHAKVVTHDHVTLSYYANVNAVSPGDEIELIIDVALDENLHVYAPPGGPFLPVDWQIAPQPGVTIHPVVFPSGQKLRVKDETAAIYTGTFRLTRRVSIAPQNEITLDSQGNVALKAAFKFQACDDEICYKPVEIPLEWKLGLAPAEGSSQQ